MKPAEESDWFNGKIRNLIDMGISPVLQAGWNMEHCKQSSIMGAIRNGMEIYMACPLPVCWE